MSAIVPGVPTCEGGTRAALSGQWLQQEYRYNATDLHYESHGSATVKKIKWIRVKGGAGPRLSAEGERGKKLTPINR